MPGFRQYPVIVLRVLTEIFLDGTELWLQNALLRQHQRLQAARHAPVAVREGVDHYQIQVSHRGLDEHMMAL